MIRLSSDELYFVDLDFINTAFARHKKTNFELVILKTFKELL